MLGPTHLPSMLGDDEQDDEDDAAVVGGATTDVCEAAEQALRQLSESTDSDEASSPRRSPSVEWLDGARMKLEEETPCSALARPSQGTDPAFESLLFELRARQEECERLRAELAAAQASRSHPGSPAALPLPPSTEPSEPALATWRLAEPDGHLPELESVLAVDEAVAASAGYPCPIASLDSYLKALRIDGGLVASAAPTASLPTARLASRVLGMRMASICGRGELPRELVDASFHEAAGRNGDNFGQHLLNLGGRPTPCASSTPTSAPLASTPAVSSTCPPLPFPVDSQVPVQRGWNALFEGAAVPVDAAVCGAMADVPPLPNPLTVLTDVPAIVDQMLSAIPEADRDSQRFLPPVPLAPFPGLFRGLGGLLPALTPQQIAMNAVAAALLNRLSANTLAACARRLRGNTCVPPRRSEAELAVMAARRDYNMAEGNAKRARAEAAVALQEIRDFRARYETDMERQRELEALVGWKTSVAREVEAELEAAEARLRTAEMTTAGTTIAPLPPWHSLWTSPVPVGAAAEPIFRVRLTAKSPLLRTVSEFIDAMQQGALDRSSGGGCGGAGGILTRHMFEAAFVRQAQDGMLLCNGEPNTGVYSHIPAPATASTGLLVPVPEKNSDATDDNETKDLTATDLRTVRPLHGLRLQMQGHVFSFTVVFRPVGSVSAAFVGIGVQASSYPVPWNPVEYGDVLWAREAEDAVRLCSILAAQADLVGDPGVPLGPFSGLRELNGDVPLGTAAIALLQAAVYGETKMWPIALPDGARTRWEFSLRSLQHLLRLHTAEDDALDLDAVRDELLPRLLEALKRVPDDTGTGVGSAGVASGSEGTTRCDTAAGGGRGGNRGNVAGCLGVSDRLRRMQMSALPKVPLNGSVAFQARLEEVVAQWSEFVTDTGCV
eukprot:TRINITY_DN57064_c0_g1_i1.p1 TRINITY_DN57064_c0_g1~~TRINITY_DN57064_c0_g1_i1.p1  ORF type:complete len:898 (-),score=164.43 TRINITY_DN57064_c0_g1_i1:134-2827(-)